MSQSVLKNIINFILLVLVQTLILNNIQFLGFVNPCLYLLFILSQPVRQSRVLTLILAFVLGITIDIFSNTLGMHTFATVFVAYIRIYVIRMFVSLDDGVNLVPTFKTFGIASYIKYLAVIVVVHHSLLFFLEAFSFVNFIQILIRIAASSVITILLIIGVRSLSR